MQGQHPSKPPSFLFQDLWVGEREPRPGWPVVRFCPFTSPSTEVTSLAELTRRVLPCSFLRGVRAQKIEQKCWGSSFIFKKMNKRIFLEGWELRMLGISLPWPFFHLIISCQKRCVPHAAESCTQTVAVLWSSKLNCQTQERPRQLSKKRAARWQCF